MNIGAEIIIKTTNQSGKIVGQSKGLWIVEMSNGTTTTYPTNKLKIK